MKRIHDFSTICICAVRYACGRSTYMPMVVQGFIKANLSMIDDNSIKVMISDIEDQNCAESSADALEWLSFREKLKDELKHRSKKE